MYVLVVLKSIIFPKLITKSTWRCCFFNLSSLHSNKSVLLLQSEKKPTRNYFSQWYEERKTCTDNLAQPKQKKQKKNLRYLSNKQPLKLSFYYKTVILWTMSLISNTHLKKLPASDFHIWEKVSKASVSRKTTLTVNPWTYKLGIMSIWPITELKKNLILYVIF